ncbi:MAG: hypothetical protein HY718_15440 [Planctomycetes bacterium]|nr:hypothetical protein [Planctomycetota bacterium]
MSTEINRRQRVYGYGVAGLAVVTGLFLGLPGSAALAAPAAVGVSAGPITVANRRQLFIDQRFLPEARGVELRVHKPIKTGEMTIKPERPWEQGGIGPYSSVSHDDAGYHMWYHTMTTVQWHTGEGRGCICYATSKDGIHWERPDLGVAEFDGSKQNNIVMGFGAAGLKLGQDGGMVFRDPTAPADQKYRMPIRAADLGEGIHIFSSGDGIHWRLTHKSAITARSQAKGHHLDSQNVVFYDERLGKYVAYLRRNVSDPGSQGRSIARGESATLDGFSVVQDLPVVLGPDREDLFHGQTQVVDYYMSAAIRYPWADDAYFMFPTAYYHYIGGGVLPEFKNEIPTNAGPLDTRFAASRDGIKWERFDREPFVPLGMKGEFDWASTRTIWGIVPDVTGRYMYLYYRGSDWLHGWDRDERNKRLLTEAGLGASQNIAVLSRLVLRRDGFVSVHGAYAGGEFTTPPLVFTGGRLLINVDTSAAGIVRVGLLDGEGRSVPGFGVDECDMIHTTNDVNRLVSWHGRSDVKDLANKPVRLRFVLRDADLYAFQFAD